ncbi:hypothetical protein ACCD06_02210 [Azospirillum sp. CT11-132]|jgi:hypothetical protein|uniref:hypothetical protein n=1 Tax=Azospirillum sp. CT11-132 TaxID=3396317 RepID=UPI0039A5DBE5
MSKAVPPTPDAVDPASKFDDIIRPEELHHITEEEELARMREALEHEKKREQEQAALRDAFMNQHIRHDANERFTNAVRLAAERGVTELQITRFPSTYCTDRGRAINNFEPDWPSTLTGFAREAFDIYAKHLKEKGYRMEARILDYPGGMPGDVGLFLRW